jgi:hypothetical protein
VFEDKGDDGVGGVGGTIVDKDPERPTFVGTLAVPPSPPLNIQISYQPCGAE